MSRCTICGRSSRLIADSLSVCLECLRRRPSDSLLVVREKRRSWRKKLGLPSEKPRGPGLPCRICINECIIPSNARGYCGIWVNRSGRLEPLTGHGVLAMYAYLDPHPTNCVAGHLCPANTSRGYPEYTFTRGVEYGYSNLAVFMLGCPLDCAFCQNWQHKTEISDWKPGIMYRWLPENLVEKALALDVSCVCYFGGDPTPHSPILVSLSRRILEKAREKGNLPKRICWETDGLVNPSIMKQMARLSLESGGIVKIDWKAWTPSVYEALTGVDGSKAQERLRVNSDIVASMARERPEVPLLVISILLVPGYVDDVEVDGITSYISTLIDKYNVDIPVVFLAFHGEHLMRDLPPTSRRHMDRAVSIARKNGIREVYIGNEWLLGPYY